MKALVIGTRGSPLALAQTTLIKAMLLKAHPELPVEIKIIKTSGDLFGNLSLTKDGGKGLFTKEIEDQLLDGSIDLAIHSMKDLPTTLPAGLAIGATPIREDARDVLIAKRAKTVDELPPNARVATSSIRRRAQLLARRPDLRIEEIRGNVGTRLEKFAGRDDLDAMILAAAGLRRLGLYEARWPMLDPEVMLPAVGQGIIGCEIREADVTTREALAAINHADTLACGMAERTYLRLMGGGCQLPYAAHATVTGETLRLVAAKFSDDGSNYKKADVTGRKSNPAEIGERAAKQVSA
jgi:hydroxymethylbilane synthase